jgi:pimeloyl-ACP methyl ester carboxylesterase
MLTRSKMLVAAGKGRSLGTGARRRFGVFAAAVIAIASLTAVSAARGAHRRPPLEIDLNTFDGMKKTVALPNGEVLAYIDTGDPAGPALVLIHGYTDNARDWVPMLPYLSKRFRLILIDLRGHGQSSKPECCYTRVDFAYDIKLLLDVLSIQKADIVGHSLGSIVAQTFAEFWPERTSRVVLIASTGGRPPGSTGPPQFDFAAEIRKLKEPIDPDSPFMIAWWDSPTPVDPEFIRRQRKDAAAIPLKVWLAVLDQGLSSGMAYTELQSTLPRLEAPTLLIWGSKDPIIEEPARKTLIDALPKARVKIFEGLGHNPFWEDPAGVADAVNSFLLQ